MPGFSQEWSLEDSTELAYLLREAGADLIDCSSGGNIYNARIPATGSHTITPLLQDSFFQ